MSCIKNKNLFQPQQALEALSKKWDDDILKQLMQYISIPAKSPMFEPEWKKLGLLDKVLENAADWIRQQNISGLKLEILHFENRTPLLFFEIASTQAGPEQTVLMYGHLDKQPEATGWREDLGPWTPKYENGRLYGRGSADDGYAVYSAIAAVGEVQRQKQTHPRIVGLIETCEESGSVDLPFYIDLLRERLGRVELVICLDSGAGNYDQLWITSSLRGNITGTLNVKVLNEGVHSGASSGIIPSSFRVIRQLLERLEDSHSGKILPDFLNCEVPQERLEQTEITAKILGKQIYAGFPWADAPNGASSASVQPVTTDDVQALLNRAWRPTLSVTGAEGLPPINEAGNVTRPYTAFKLSIRTPPLLDATNGALKLKSLLEDNPPYQAHISFEDAHGSNGWNAPKMQTWFDNVLQESSKTYFGAPCAFIGEGGTIPLLGLLSEKFPTAQMMVCGVLGPESNAHGPNEFLHVPYVKRLTATVAQVIASMPEAQE